MNPKKHKSPKIEVTTENETLDLDLPDGSKVSGLKIDGEEVHQTYCLVKQMSQFRKCWMALGAFCTIATVACTIMAAWLVNRVNNLPVDTAQIQRMIDKQRPPIFEVGQFVKVADHGFGQIRKISRGNNGGYIYMVGGVHNGGWHPQSSLTYVRESRDATRVTLSTLTP